MDNKGKRCAAERKVLRRIAAPFRPDIPGSMPRRRTARPPPMPRQPERKSAPGRIPGV